MPNIRRSLTIIEENDVKVQQRRAMFLNVRPPIDMDYTTTVNMLVELGDLLFKQNWANPSIMVDAKEVMSIISKYAFSTTLKEEGLFDQYQDALIHNLPKLIELYQKTTTTTQQKQTPPEVKRAEQEVKKGNEYVS